jgi:hypothetical protein
MHKRITGRLLGHFFAAGGVKLREMAGRMGANLGPSSPMARY